jgi:hypothetical protein
MTPIKGIAHIGYHIFIIILSAAISLSLPLIIRLIARKFLIYWSVIENEKIFLVSIEIVTAVLLIVFFNTIWRGFKQKKLSRMARGAGLVFVSSAGGIFGRNNIRKLKERHGQARDIMVIGSTGARTFVNPDGDLHKVIGNCREAKIMLLDPFGEGAVARSRSINASEITTNDFSDQIYSSMDFLKGLNAVHGNIRLKLYADPPLLKLAILGDYISVQHYHTGLDVRRMPEYIFHHGQNPGSLYTYFYQYFLARWNDPGIPEYALETDELIYRDSDGNEIRREKFRGGLWPNEGISYPLHRRRNAADMRLQGE